MINSMINSMTNYFYKNIFLNSTLRFIILVFILIHTYNFNALSENKIEIKDTTLQRGRLNKVNIFGQLNDLNISEDNITKFNFQFDSRLIHIDTIEYSILSDIEKNQFYFNQQININRIYNSTSPELSTFEITFKGINQNFTNIPNSDSLNLLFSLNCEALVGSDSIGFIEPILVSIDDNPISNFSFKRGRFYLGIPIFDIEKESIGNVYPNPFGDFSSIEFTLVKDSKVSVAIYSLQGGLVSMFPDMIKNVKYLFVKGNDILDYDGTTLLNKGKYRISIDPDNNYFSSGAYVIFININGNLLKTNFIFQK